MLLELLQVVQQDDITVFDKSDTENSKSLMLKNLLSNVFACTTLHALGIKLNEMGSPVPKCTYTKIFSFPGAQSVTIKFIKCDEVTQEHLRIKKSLSFLIKSTSLLGSCNHHQSEKLS